MRLMYNIEGKNDMRAWRLLCCVCNAAVPGTSPTVFEFNMPNSLEAVLFFSAA